jgi:hypothetical protein
MITLPAMDKAELEMNQDTQVKIHNHRPWLWFLLCH